MRLTIFGLAAAGAFLAGCSGVAPGALTAPYSSGEPSSLAQPSEIVLPEPLAEKGQLVYWTFYAARNLPEVQYTRVPLKAKSKARDIGGSTANDLNYSSGMAIDSKGRLWILSFGHYSGDPGTVVVFKTPMKAKSRPLYTFILSGSDGPNALTFDASGNLWVTSPGNDSILQYSAPFTKSGKLSPAITVAGPPSAYDPSGVAVGASGDVYVSNFDSTGTQSIGVLKPPYKHNPYWLNGLTAPGGLIFDKKGNLYASSNATKSASPEIVRYNSNDLASGDTPSIVDSNVPSSSYEASFAFSAKGDLYFANCGSPAGIDVYPTGSKPFSSKLAPSVVYTNADLAEAGCAWGIAIK